MLWPLLRACIWITAAYLALWGCFAAFSQWNQPPPLPVSANLLRPGQVPKVTQNRQPPPLPANLPPLASGAPGRFDVVALPVNFEASALNNKGEVAGTWDTHEPVPIYEAVSNAAIWHQGRVRLIARLGGTHQGAGMCLSDNGWLGGSAGNIFVDPIQDPSYAVVWNMDAKNAAVQWQGQLPNLSRATVLSVNTRGQAVGTSASSCDGEMRDGMTVPGAGVPYVDIIHGFFWDGQATQDLGEGEACGINENGQVVGTQNKKIVLWQNGRTYTLGDGKAYAINNRGQIAGTSPYEAKKPPEQQTFGSVAADENDPTAPAFHAMLWDKGVIEDLGALASNWNSTAVAVNDRGQAVGNSVYAANWKPEDARAFLWQAGKMHDLNTLLPKHSDWVLYDARSINNKGWIVGSGSLHGETRSFLLVPK